jgi:hypothetical protein
LPSNSPFLKEFVGHGIVVDRQEEIGLQVVGRGDTPDQAGSRIALGQQQFGLGKAFGFQLLLDPPRQPQIEEELGNVAGAGRALRLGGMPDIQHDPEFRGIAGGCGRLRGGRIHGDRPQGRKPYGMVLWRSDMFRQGGRL